MKRITREMVLDAHPCIEARDWLVAHPDSSAQELWAMCPRGDWLLWICCRFNLLDNKTAVQIACAVVRETPIGDGRTVWDLLEDPRSRQAIEVAEAWVKSESTLEDVKSVAITAVAAARAAHSARIAAIYATYAAADAIASAAAVNASTFVATAVSALALAVPFNPPTTAYTDFLQGQADIVRRFVTPIF